MGAQIAALMANAGLNVQLLDLPGEQEPTQHARSGLEKALQSRPAAFYLPEIAAQVQLGSLNDLSGLAKADWVIEAVVEDLDLKERLLAQVEEVVGPSTLVSSNTSGLSIEALARGRSTAFQKRFMGIHFFNPPRYMELVEMIPGPLTETRWLEEMSQWLTKVLGKGVVRCKDTPNFIANRLGVFALMDLLHRWGESEWTVEQLDGLTAGLLGRPKTATLRLCDIIGLDILVDVAQTAYQGLATDPWRETFKPPLYINDMLEAGFLGAKTQAGFYRKTATGLEVLEKYSLGFRPLGAADLGEMSQAAKAKDLKARLDALFMGQGTSSVFVRYHLLQVLAYAATHAEAIADDIYQIDRAMRWGFNWEAGPFEIWDLIGHDQVKAGLVECGTAVPELIKRMAADDITQFYPNTKPNPAQVYTPRTGQFEDLPVVHPATALLIPARARLHNQGAFLVELDESIGALVLQGKLNVIGQSGLDLIGQVAADAPYEALVLCGSGENLSAGADLAQISALVMAGDWAGLDAFVKAFQDAVLALRYAPFPVVAVPWGLALGGGCEFSLAMDGRVAEADLKIGLVETQVGVIPGAGGCKEMARRNGTKIDTAFEVLFNGRFSDNAYQGRKWGLLSSNDPICMGREQALTEGMALARSLADGYQAPQRAKIKTAGTVGLERLAERLDKALVKGEITAHDQHIGMALAKVLCGGEGANPEVDEQTLLDMERETFLQLCGEALTQARMAHMLKTGKPLKN